MLQNIIWDPQPNLGEFKNRGRIWKHFYVVRGASNSILPRENRLSGEAEFSWGLNVNRKKLKVAFLAMWIILSDLYHWTLLRRPLRAHTPSIIWCGKISVFWPHSGEGLPIAERVKSEYASTLWWNGEVTEKFHQWDFKICIRLTCKTAWSIARSNTNSQRD